MARICILGRLVCRCHDVFLWVLRLFCFAFVFMLSLKPRPFVQSFDMQARFFLLPLLFVWGCRFFRVFFLFFAPFSLSLCMESTSYVLSFRMVSFYLVITGWIFYISLCENSISQLALTGSNKIPQEKSMWYCI